MRKNGSFLAFFLLGSVGLQAQVLQPDKTFGANGRHIIYTRELNYSGPPCGIFRTVLDKDHNIFCASRPNDFYYGLLTKVSPTGVSSSGFGASGMVQFGDMMATGILLKENNLYVTGSNGALFPMLGAGNAMGVFPSSYRLSQTFAPIFSSTFNEDSTSILLGGSMAKNGVNNYFLSRIKLNGSLDTSFSKDGELAFTAYDGIGGWIHDLAVLPSGKFLTFGHQGNRTMLARWHKNGTLDSSFGVKGMMSIQLAPATYGYALRVTSQHLFVYGGTKDATGKQGDLFVAKISLEGVLDASYGTNGVAQFGTSDLDVAGWSGISILTDGSILLGATVGSTSHKTLLAKLDPTGKPDATFNSGSFFKIGGTGSYNTLTSLNDSTFIAVGYNPDASYYSQFIDKYLVSTNMVTSELVEAMDVRQLAYYANGAIYIDSDVPVEEVRLHTLEGKTLSYHGLARIPVQEKQLYVVQWKSGSKRYSKKVFTN